MITLSIVEAIILGAVQGISEFLPISSTAHIIIAQLLLGYSIPGLSFEIFLHLGSIIAVILFFWRDITHIVSAFFRYLAKREKEDRSEFYFGLYLIVATMITGFLGVMLEDVVGNALKTPIMIAIALALTGIFLIAIERFHQVGNKSESEMSWFDAIIIGFVQTLAVIPGISRSGSTLIAGLYTGLNRDTAVRFSFLLSIPVILGSSVLAITDISAGSFRTIGTGPLIAAFITSFVTSLIGIIWLIDFLKKGRLIYFALYCFLLAAIVLAFLDEATVL